MVEVVVEREFKDGDVDIDRAGALSLADAAERDGPRRRAAIAFLSRTYLLNSYLSMAVLAGDGFAIRGYVPRMNFSSSLSRSASIMFVGGGCLLSSGL